MMLTSSVSKTASLILLPSRGEAARRRGSVVNEDNPSYIYPALTRNIRREALAPLRWKKQVEQALVSFDISNGRSFINLSIFYLALPTPPKKKKKRKNIAIFTCYIRG